MNYQEQTKALIKKSGLKLSKIAEIMGISYHTVISKNRGERQYTQENYDKLYNYLNGKR